MNKRKVQVVINFPINLDGSLRQQGDVRVAAIFNSFGDAWWYAMDRAEKRQNRFIRSTMIAVSRDDAVSLLSMEWFKVPAFLRRCEQLSIPFLAELAKYPPPPVKVGGIDTEGMAFPTEA